MVEYKTCDARVMKREVATEGGFSRRTMSSSRNGRQAHCTNVFSIR